METNVTEETFVAGKLQAMSLLDKVGQMTMAERMHVTPEQVKRFALGSVLSGGGSHPGNNRPEDWVKMNDEFWQAATEEDDSPGIPILFGIDAVHGHNNVRGATLFPHNIAFGAAGDTDLVKAAARITAREILASGLEWNFAPTLAVVQNCQWGRTYESYGDDPELIAAFGKAYVESVQDEGVMGCVKHWVGDGGTDHGVDQGETTLTFEQLRDVHIAPYLPALQSGVLSVMVSFNSWNGLKCHGHRGLVNDYLKGDLGFEGIVVSDWDGIDYLDENYDKAIELSVSAGIDLFMVPERWQLFIERLVMLVESGRVPLARIDDAVTRILRTKLRFGLFDLPRPSLRPGANGETFGSLEHRAVARTVVQKSQVLLKNDDHCLPLNPDSRVIVAGKNANNLGAQCGGWTVSWQGEENGERIEGTTIWQGIAEASPNAVLSQGLDGADADPLKHDVAVVVVGETAYAEGHGDIRPSSAVLDETKSKITGWMRPLDAYGDSLQLARLHPEDLACIQTISSKGIPVVVVLISGRPLVVEPELALSKSFIAAWLPGSEGGGVADLLFGRVPFSGKLPLAWPAADCQSGAKAYPTLFERGYGLGSETSVDNVVFMNYKH